MVNRAIRIGVAFTAGATRSWASVIPYVYNPPDRGGAAVWVFETR